MKQHLNKEKATESRSAANRVSTNSQPIQTKSIPGGVIQLGKKKNAIKRAKDQKGGVKHHIRPEYQDENEKQMELIASGVDRKEAKRMAKAALK